MAASERALECEWEWATRHAADLWSEYRFENLMCKSIAPFAYIKLPSRGTPDMLNFTLHSTSGTVPNDAHINTCGQRQADSASLDTCSQLVLQKCKLSRRCEHGEW